MPAPVRGQVYRVDIGYGRKPWLIISNNQRNRALDTVLAARITTTDKSFVVTAVPLGPQDPLAGFVLADDIQQLDDVDLRDARRLGCLGANTMLQVNRALELALGLP